MTKSNWDKCEGQLDTELVQQELPRWLANKRWFGAKSRAITSVEIIDSVAISTSSIILFALVHYEDGEPDTYQIPLLYSTHQDGNQGLPLQDAVDDENFRQELLHIIAQDIAHPVSDNGALKGCHSAGFAVARGTHPLPARVSKTEQSNTNILYGDKLILKLFRRLQLGKNPDVEIGRFLTDVAHFPHIPRFLGEITLSRPGTEPTSCAMLQEFVPSQGDGWQWTLAALATYYEAATPDAEPYLKAASLLGRRTAELHLALATETTDPAFRAEPLTVALLADEAQRIRDQIHLAVDTLQQAFPSLTAGAATDAATILSRRSSLLAQANAILDHPPSGNLIRIHGDYHLGQVLRAKDDFVLLDFEGEPARSFAERRRKQSPLKDVAGMLRSFSYAAWVGLENHSKVLLSTWPSKVSAGFLAAYFETMAPHPGLLPDDPLATSLLQAFLLQKNLYELLYELNNRPTWVRIPLAGLVEQTRLINSPE